MKRTPTTDGDWRVAQDACVVADAGPGTDWRAVADCRTVDSSAEEAAANAATCAAAKEALDALAGLVELWPLAGYQLEAYCYATLVPAALAALRKAGRL